MKRTNFNTISKLLFVFFMGALASCEVDIERKDVQVPYTYSDQYYEDLRAYKASEHQMSFMWFADYSSAHSYGLHFLGLPDSLDICSLWGGVPSEETHPKTYKEMRFCQKVKGTKMVMVLFPSVGHREDLMALPEEQIVQTFGDELIKSLYDKDLDGIDLDYEIDGDWMHGENFVKLIKYLGKYIGPKGEDSSKLLIVDSPWPILAEGAEDAYQYLSYYVSQVYNCPDAEYLQMRFEELWLDGKGVPAEKLIVTENMGDFYMSGGNPFTEADGNKYLENGERLHSLEGMSRWNPIQGRKGGFGAFYGQRDYNSNPPYKYFRNAIQHQNPAVK